MLHGDTLHVSISSVTTGVCELQVANFRATGPDSCSKEGLWVEISGVHNFGKPLQEKRVLFTMTHKLMCNMKFLSQCVYQKTFKSTLQYSSTHHLMTEILVMKALQLTCFILV